jgi:hypothetical protein
VLRDLVRASTRRRRSSRSRSGRPTTWSRPASSSRCRRDGRGRRGHGDADRPGAGDPRRDRRPADPPRLTTCRRRRTSSPTSGSDSC